MNFSLVQKMTIMTFFLCVLRITAGSIFTDCFANGRGDRFGTRDWFHCAVRTLSPERAIRFVQIGANDGVMLDPLHEAVVLTNGTRHWRGVFVEPVPHLMAALQENKRTLMPDCGYIEAAVNATCPSGGVTTFFMPIYTHSEPQWLQGIGSLEVPKGRQETGTYKRISVACRTPSEIAGEVVSRGAAPPDILLIDAEGYDINILLALKDWPFGKPALIAFEIWHPETQPHAVADMLVFLNKHSYVVVQSHDSEDWIAIYTKNIELR